MLRQQVAVLLAITSSILVLRVHAYIPAYPTNDTSILRNETDFIQINWLPMGVSAYKDALSRQLVYGQQDNGDLAGYRGALVHFDETNATSATGSRWIAMISCDGNEGGQTPVFGSSSDAVSLALQGGAMTAIMYSLESETCAIDPVYAASMNGSLDLYVTTNKDSAQAITRQFSNVSPQAYWFNETALQDSIYAINNQISSLGGWPTTSTDPTLFGSTAGASSASTSSPAAAPTTAPGGEVEYLIATIANAGANQNGGNVTTVAAPDGNSSRGTANTGLAMIILYAITGCVTILFLIVITSGAIRAMRHPERYGPRRNGGGAGGQSRAAGLTQAILDTFPVVKFFPGQSGQQRAQGEHGSGAKDEEYELDATNVPMHVLDHSNTAAKPETTEIDGHGREISTAITLAAAGTGGVAAQHGRDATDATAVPSEPTDDIATRSARASIADDGPATIEGTNPADVNDSITCPICLLDFEDGDDLRILPCDARHRFHDACVVPWLLNVSSLCPLCRLDLSKDHEASEEPEQPAPAPTRSRFRNLLRPSSSATQLQQSDSVAAGRNSSEAGGSAAPASIQEEGAASEQQQPTQSRFMRYVQQRRNRVNARARGMSRSSGSALPGIDASQVQQNMQNNLSPSGIPLNTVRP